MSLEKNPESIDSYADLAKFLGRRVSMYLTKGTTWFHPDVIRYDGNASIDYEHTPSAYPQTFVACTDKPRVEGTLVKFADGYGVTIDQSPPSVYVVNERIFRAANLTPLEE